MSTQAIAKAQPLISSGSKTGAAKEREDRAQRFASVFVKFIDEHIDLLIEVRADFLAKPKNELICGVKTFTEYCVEVLKYSEGHIRSLIQGRNPATARHDGSKKRKTKASAEEPSAPLLRRKNSDGTTTPIPPAEFTAGDALVAAKRFLASAVAHLSPQDKDIFYRSLSLHIEDILNAASANPKQETFAAETERLLAEVHPGYTPNPPVPGPRTVEIIGGICPYRTDLTTPPDFFSLAMEHVPWKTEPGKRGNPALRKTALWGSPYDYLGPRSNQPLGPLSEMPEWLAALKKINDATLGVTTDNVLLNLYADGKAGINPHSDWGNPIVIGSWSFGEERRVFRIIRDSEKHDLEPAHGSMIVIPGEVNDAWQHLVLKTAKARIQPRINVTFRKFAVQP